MRVLVIDNYDSFTYNLVQYLGELGAEPDVVRNDVATVDELLEREPDRVLVSPGPVHARPRRASRSRCSGASPSRARRRSASASATRRWRTAFGGQVVRGEPMHGKTAQVEHDGRGVFRGLRSPLIAGRYHSLIVDPDLPRLPRALGLARRHGHGDPPPRAARRGRAVPPRVGAHRGRQGAAAELPRRT